ncbi:MAG TPA: GspE/PulE family protein [Sedimentisphaerales bacterium]|nr:GspE/PulE family protein [Sedimentisphaerales bacterium]
MQNQDNTISYIRSQNILDEQTLQKVLEQQQMSGQGLINILKDNNVVTDEQFTKIVAATNNIEFINLSADMVDSMAAHMITYEMANLHNIIPVKKSGKNLMVAMSEPLNLTLRDQIELRTGCKIIPLAATTNAIKQAIRYHFNVQNLARQTVASMHLKADNIKEKSDRNQLEIKSSLVPDDPITRLVSSIVSGAVDAGASDIHLEQGTSNMRVRYRINGLLHDVIDVPSSAQLEVVSHIKVMADMDISEKRISQDGHITLKHDDNDYDLRVSSLPAVSGEKIVIRILDKNTAKWSLDEIVTSEDDNQKLRSLAKNPYGMILLTGPTGSGKTTTLYSVLQLLNSETKNIVTVEDPVEYRIDGVTQVQVNPTAGRTFASALRSILRQDPDVILIGEIRDYETAEIAVSAALTGHLVLSTLHTNDAAGAISRLINFGIQPFLIASALLGAITQRLVRTVCPICKQSYTPSAEELDILFSSSDKNKSIQLLRGQGCDSCYQTGYAGRKAIYEILCVSYKIRKMIAEVSSDDSIKAQAISEGMKTLRKSGMGQVLNCTTTLDELMRVVDMRTE